MGTITTSHSLFKEQRLSPFLKKLLPYSLYALLPIALIHYCFSPVSFSPIHHFPSTNRIIIPSSPPPLQEACDYTNGEWLPNKSGPLYNGSSCNTIKPGQNCMLFGRPDKDYLHWRWKPEKCNLSRFRPELFLKLLKNKHIAFVGDSMARNQLESLICMLSTFSKPHLFYKDGSSEDNNRFRKWKFPSHNLNISIYWSPFLVKGVEKNSQQNFNTLYLDEIDEKWASDLNHTDILVLSVGHWFLHPAKFYYQDSVLGCHYYTQNCTEIGFYDAFTKALKTTFEKITQRKGIKAFLTTFSPAHFEGEWDKFGACSKTQPFEKNEKILDGVDLEMRRIGVAEVEIAKRIGNGVRLEALDITKLALLRPDGHPGPYMYAFPFANGIGPRVQNDCVHWCLPGPIDTWNEILLDVIKRWEGGYKGER